MLCAAGYAEEQTYSFAFDTNKSAGGVGFWNTNKTVTTLTSTLNGIDWTLVSDSYYMGYSATNGQQVGSATTPAHEFSISTEGIEGLIKEVKVTARCKDGSTSTVAVKVGGVNYLSSDAATAALTKDNTEFTFTPETAKQGKVELLFNQEDNSKAAAINIISFSVVYDPDATEETAEPATWEYEWNKTKANGGEGFYNFGSSFVDYDDYLEETINGITWRARAEGTKKFAMTASGGQTIGTGTSDNATHVEFWTDGINGKVTDITVNARLNKAEYSGHIKVSVGGVTYLYNNEEQAAMSSDPTEYKFVAPTSGAVNGTVKIELFQTSEARGTLYLRALKINYLKSNDPTPDVTAPADPVISRTQSYNSDYLFNDEDIVITTETEGATIYYTLDAADTTEPKDPKTSDERIEYTAPITVTKSTKISAVAMKDDVYSNVVTRTFTMWKNPQIFFEGYNDEATVEVGYVGIPIALDNPHNVGPIEWTSEDETIATVDADGTVHALKEGQVNINFFFAGNDEYFEMGGRLKLTVEAATEYVEGTYTHIWDKGRNDGGEGFYNFGSTSVDSYTFTESLSGVNWTATTEGSNVMAYTANNGQAFGQATSKPCTHIELTTDGISGQVTEVIVASHKGTASADLSNAALKVSVNGTPYLYNSEESVPLTATSTQYSFKPAGQPQEGEIKIEVNQDSETKVVIYFKSIVVNYRTEVTGIAAPTATPEPGIYDEAQSVELSAESGAAILYTTDGTNPKTSTTAETYAEAINITQTTNIKAVAKVGDKFSDVVDLNYVIRKDPELSFEVASKEVEYRDVDLYMGAYLNNPHNVSPITYSSSDTSILLLDEYADFYTMGVGTATITATFAGNDEYLPATASYTVTVTPLEPLLTPTVTPAGGTFTEPVEVTITAAADWGDRAVTLWYSTEAQTVEEMEDDWLYTVWPESPSFDYSQTTKTITIDKSCRLIVEAKGYNSLSSEPVICDFVIEATDGISDIHANQLSGNEVIYNLKGQRVSTPIRGNIYIIDGRKVMMK